MLFHNAYQLGLTKTNQNSAIIIDERYEYNLNLNMHHQKTIVGESLVVLLIIPTDSVPPD